MKRNVEPQKRNQKIQMYGEKCQTKIFRFDELSKKKKKKQVCFYSLKS